MLFQEGFQSAVDEVTWKCKEYFSDRLEAIYITGSVSTNEAIVGESDLDYWGFIEDEVSAADKLWLSKTELEIDRKFQIFDGVHINFRSIEFLQKDKFVRFMLKYNSILYYGRDIISEIDSSGFGLYEPNKTVAKARLAFAKQYLEDALENKCPKCMDKIPGNTYFAARKFARYFVLVEGAYFLMCKGKFESFSLERVIQQLKENSTGHDDILDLSLEVIRNPIDKGVKHTDFIVKVRPFTEWIFTEIEKA
jgi:hypothetical protein